MPEREADLQSALDDADRRRLRDEHDRTFFVEAGAGTGKTTALVSRIVALVAAGRLTLPRLVAITFTEAAAAELRDRIRVRLDEAARSQDTEMARTRCAWAASEVDLASIQTIHAFAGTLLRTYPVEARLPPGFEVLDTIQSNLLFDERFQTWLYDEVLSKDRINASRQEVIRRALSLGMTLDEVRDLAKGLQDHADLLDATTTWNADPVPDPLGVAHRRGNELLGLRDRVPLAKNGEADPLVVQIRRVEFSAVRFLGARDVDEALIAFQGMEQPKHTVGRQSDWRSDSSGQSPVPAIKASLREGWEEITSCLAAHRAAAFAELLAVLRDFTLEFIAERRCKGMATFHDLLTWTRDLLRDDPDVRSLARRRFDRIFVDEFQDTDPLQAEIVWYLASDGDQLVSGSWQDLRLIPGKMFLVGDPKQSIYRFRGADLQVYQRIVGKAGANQQVSLVQNFRSLDSIIDWVNHYFSRQMVAEDGVQAVYVPLRASTAQRTGFGGTRVYLVGGPVPALAAEIRRQEADATALLAERAVAEEWPVRARPQDSSRRPGDQNGKPEDPVRAMRYADICVLLPTRANLPYLEDAFERRGVPYRVESGSLVLDTQEVRDLLSALRAIDDPSDQVALVAALRSGAYACSDPDLLTWVQEGRTFNYEDLADDAAGPVADALLSLARFHRERVDRSAAATIDAFIRERTLALAALSSPRPRESWRRLRYVVRQARGLAAAGRPGLRATVEWLEAQRAARQTDPESPLPESDEDAVRVLTIHGAKGLEFPLVILTDLGRGEKGQEARVAILATRDLGRIEARCGPFQTDGYDLARSREKRCETAEAVRLLYVAATRARDHLALCVFHKEGASSHAARVLTTWRDDGSALARVLDLVEHASVNGGGEAGVSSIGPIASPDDHLRAERRWLSDREERVRVLGSRRALSLNQLVQAPTDGSTVERGPDQVTDIESEERGGTETGEVVERARVRRAARLLVESLGHGSEDSKALARGVAERVKLPATLVENLAAGLVHLAGLGKAPPAARVWSALAAGAVLDGVLVEGKIDLLYEQRDGTLGLFVYLEVDPDGNPAINRPDVRLSLGGAILVVETGSGRVVRRAGTINPSGQVRTIDDVDLLREEFRVAQRARPLPPGSGFERGEKR